MIPIVSETRSTCPYCGVGCGVIIEAQGAQITGVRGDPEHPANHGRLCSKGSTLALTRPQLDALVLGLPWTPWLLALRGRTPAVDATHASIRVLMGVWVLVVVGFFSLPQSKLIGYVLPAVPPLGRRMTSGQGTPVRQKWVAAWLMI